jgi:general secretion pathway protein F
MRYRAKTLGGGGAVAVVEVDAATRADAEAILRQRGLSILSIQGDLSPGAWLKGSRRRFPLLLFAQQLIALLDAGLGTVEALEALAVEKHGTEAAPIRAVLDEVYAGRSFSAAMEKMPLHFPPLFIATIRASERTGDLQEALSRYVDYHSQIDRLRRKVVSASVYPAVLAVSGMAVAGFLLFYVVPRFSQIYEDIGGQLPFLSRMLMQWGQLLSAHGLTVLAAIVGVIALGAFAAAQPGWRRWVRDRMWSIPRLGAMLRIYQLARFYRTLGMLLRSGMPLFTALGMAEGLLDPALRPSLQAARDDVNAGLPASEALRRHELTTPMALSMLRVGERTGELGSMMDRAAALYDDELTRWVDLGTRLIEPLLMAAIGILIGLIVILLYLPVFELANSLQ